MEIELHPAISLLEETFNVLIAPVDMLVETLNSHLNLQRYKILYICGNYSRILTRLDRNLTDLDIRQGVHILPAHDHPGGEPPQLPDRRT
jgi:hypothetical protein